MKKGSGKCGHLVRRTFAILFGYWDCHPLSRAEYLPRVLRLFFLRLPVVTLIAYFSLKFLNSPETAFTWQIFLITCTFLAIVGLMFPYFMLIYMRLLGSKIPFRMTVSCVVIAVAFFFPIGSNFWEAYIAKGFLGLTICTILYLLPDKNKENLHNEK